MTRSIATPGSRPILLDLFCCQGGAAQGYADAGFEVFGVDINPQPRYQHWFHQGDALADGIRCFVRGDEVGWLHISEFDAIHASPPCQAHTNLIEPTRQLLREVGKPFVIENVPNAPLIDPIELCGATFGLETYRHRLFETNWGLTAPPHREHVNRVTKMGRPPRQGEFMHVVGNFSGVGKAREVMGMPWANRDGLREAIPPAYTQFIGAQLLNEVKRRAPMGRG